MSLRAIERYRRLQIGGIGLAAVLLLVGLAGILGERSLDRDGSASKQAVARDDGKAAPSEPLSELGVQPAPAADKADEKALPAPASRGAPADDSNALPPEVKPGERVADLEPAAKTSPAN